jgi:hypothetical protein
MPSCIFGLGVIFVLLWHASLGEVLILTNSNFDKVISESRRGILIDIYAPW